MKKLQHRSQKLAIWILSVLCLLLFCSGSFALGLGEATLHSSLNEPLLVSIPITGTAELGPDEIKTKIASPDDFEKQGAERTYVHSFLKTRVKRTSNSEYVLEVYTVQPFKEAWVNILVDVRWPKGKIIRQEDFLIDIRK